MVQRFGQVLGVRPERFEEYRAAHAAVWPEIQAALREAGIRNYSIFHFRGQLFGYYEYVGPPEEYAARLQRLARAPRMREWWDWMEPMQVPLEGSSEDHAGHADDRIGDHAGGRPEGAGWAPMQEVFHLD